MLSAQVEKLQASINILGVALAFGMENAWQAYRNNCLMQGSITVCRHALQYSRRLLKTDTLVKQLAFD